jgi:hypothetical protein
MSEQLNIKTPETYDTNDTCGIGFIPFPELEKQNKLEEQKMLVLEQQGGII